MSSRLVLLLLATTGAVSASPSGGAVRASPNQQRRIFKDWTFARCLTKAAGLHTPAGEDAANSAAALLERGRYGIEAYAAAERLVDRQLAKHYGGSTGGSYTTLKCIDLFHSAELDALVQARTFHP